MMLPLSWNTQTKQNGNITKTSKDKQMKDSGLVFFMAWWLAVSGARATCVRLYCQAMERLQQSLPFYLHAACCNQVDMCFSLLRWELKFFFFFLFFSKGCIPGESSKLKRSCSSHQLVVDDLYGSQVSARLENVQATNILSRLAVRACLFCTGWDAQLPGRRDRGRLLSAWS